METYNYAKNGINNSIGTAISYFIHKLLTKFQKMILTNSFLTFAMSKRNTIYPRKLRNMYCAQAQKTSKLALKQIWTLLAHYYNPCIKCTVQE